MSELFNKYGWEVAFSVLTAAGTALYRWINKWMKQERDHTKATQAGVMAILSNQITQAHNLYSGQGYCSVSSRRQVEAMYIAYKGLKGNGAIDDAYEQIKSLPIEKQKGKVIKDGEN